MQLVTLQLGTGTAGAVRTSEHRASIPGSAASPRFADVGAMLLDGVLPSLDPSAGEEVRFEPAQLLTPVLSPGAVICIGLNYRTHILEMGRGLPESPTVFDKLPRSLTAPYAELVIPKAGAQQLDYEGELGVVIGKAGRSIPVESALEHVAGYTVVNDITMRDYQTRSLQWFAGKAWEACTPVGPGLVTPDEAGDLAGNELVVTVNGEVRQRALTGDLLFDVPFLVSDLSTIIELRPGDIIATGTPGGVGHGMKPPSYLQDGDVVEVSISSIGTLTNTIRFE